MKYELENLNDERDDANLWRATLKNGMTIDVDANTEDDARKQVDEAIKTYQENEKSRTNPEQ